MSLDYDNYMSIIESCEALTYTTTEVCDKFDERAKKAGAFLDTFAQSFGCGLTKSLCMQEEKEAAVIVAGITDLTNGLFSAAGDLFSGLHRKHKIKKAKKIITTKAEETKENVLDIIPDAIEFFKQGIENTKAFCKQIRKHYLLDNFDKDDDKKREENAELTRKLIGEMFTYQYGVTLGEKVLQYLGEYSEHLDSDEDLDDFIIWYDENISVNKREIYLDSYFDVLEILEEDLSDENEINKIDFILNDMDGKVPVRLTNPKSLINKELNKDVAKKCDETEDEDHAFPSFYYNNDNYIATKDLFSTIYKEKVDDYVDSKFLPFLLIPLITLPVVQIVLFLVTKLGFNIWITLLSLLVGGITGFVLYIIYSLKVSKSPVNYCFKTDAFIYLYEDFMAAIVDNEREIISSDVKEKMYKEMRGENKTLIQKEDSEEVTEENSENEEKEEELNDDDLLAQIAETGSI